MSRWSHFSWEVQYDQVCVSWVVAHRISSPPNPRNLRICYHTMQKGLCRCDYAKEPETGRPIILDYTGGVNVIIRIVTSERGRQERQSRRRRCDNGSKGQSDVAMTQTRWAASPNWKNWGINSPWRPEDRQPCWYLDVSPMRYISYFSPPEQ